MSQEPPTLEYARGDSSSRQRLKWWPSLIAVVLVLGSSLTACMCGHLDRVSFLFTVPAFGFACYGWIRNRQMSLIRRVALILVVIVTSGVLFKNIVDVMWLGHEPLWP